MDPVYDSDCDVTIKALAARGISLRSILEVYNNCLDTHAIEQGCTTGEFAHRALIPVTRGDKTSYAQFIAREDAPLLPAEVHVVHSWGMRFSDLITGIAEYANQDGPIPDDKRQLLNLEWHLEKAPENLEMRFFVCPFSVNQHTLETKHVGHPECEVDKFDCVMQEIFQAYGRPMLVVLDSECRSLKRSCCLEEIHTAIVNRVPIKFCGTGSVTFKGNIDSRLAEAHDPDMKNLIYRKIQEMNGGFDAFNRVVEDHLMDFAASNLAILKARLRAESSASLPSMSMPAHSWKQSSDNNVVLSDGDDDLQKSEPLFPIDLSRGGSTESGAHSQRQPSRSKSPDRHAEQMTSRRSQRSASRVQIPKLRRNTTSGSVTSSETATPAVFRQRLTLGASECSLKSIQPFRDAFEDDFLNCLQKLSEKRHMRKDEVILEEGKIEATPCLYALCRGSARVEKKGMHTSVLKTGEVFGEAALFNVLADRGATVTAAENCTLLCVSQSSFALALEHFPSARVAAKNFQVQLQQRWHRSHVLHEAWAFKQIQLSHAFIDCLVVGMESRVFERGQTIIEEGSLDDLRYLYVISEGNAEVCRKGCTINRLGPGDIFGEKAIFDMLSERTASVVAVERCLVQCIAMSTFMLALQDFPEERPKIRRLAEVLAPGTRYTSGRSLHQALIQGKALMFPMACLCAGALLVIAMQTVARWHSRSTRH